MSTRMVIRKRSAFTMSVCLVVFFALLFRMAWLQLVRGPELGAKAAAQWMREIPVEPKRGIIYDRNGNELAISASADTVVAIPAQIRDPEATAKQLAEVLSMDESRVHDLITRRRAAVYVARKVNLDVAQAVRALNLPGITFTEESRRFYPYGNLASHVLGFAGIDSQGLYGVELQYESYLRGTPGSLQYPTDNRGQEIPNGHPRYVPPENGYNVYLTIDHVIQHIIERELDNAMMMHNAEGAIAIVMDPKTGAILGMANRPDFDPNDFMAAVREHGTEKIWLNESISGGFEPGSTFKMITAAAGIEEGVIDENDRYVCRGFEVVAGYRLHCHRRTGHGSQDFVQVMQNSCNPGFIDLGFKLGQERLFSYIRNFGFAQRTGIDLPGEAIGVMFTRIGPLELATTSFGQGPSVTPIQQVAAVAAIANGGTLMQPHVMQEVRDEKGQLVLEKEPVAVRQVVSEDTASRVAALLENAIAQGTGRHAYLPGFRVAGKTGTAQVPRPGGGYYSNKYIASFVGFAPADDPAIAVFVAVKDPKGRYGYYGSQVAAPLFRNMAQDILYYLDVRPQAEPGAVQQTMQVQVPDLAGMTANQALGALRDTGLNIRIDGQGGTITDQIPKAGVQITAGSTVIVYLGDARPQPGEMVTVPDVRTLSLRDASMALSAVGLQINALGSGIAINQTPAPNEVVQAGTIVTVEFRP